jgi:prepilin-type N-terminal cleavage/methylation domain-containing protein
MGRIMMRQHPLLIAGFSLVELLVVLGILSIMLAIGIANIPSIRAQANFSQTLSLVDQSSNEMRARAISIQEFKNDLYPGYGIAFDTTSNNNTRLLLYADCVLDNNNDGRLGEEDSFVYTPGLNDCNGGPQLVKTIQFPPGFSIREIRYVLSTHTTLSRKKYTGRK